MPLATARLSRRLQKMRAARRITPLLHYKCCSTFDSSPEIGSLGAAMRILKPHVKNAFVPVVGGQPNLDRCCAFGNLFAGAGHGGDIFRLDRHPTMSVHPSTPMGEADLRLHLHAQGIERIGLVDWRKLGADAGSGELDTLIDAAGNEAVLFDVLDEQHLGRIGEVIWRRAAREPLLAVGASSMAQAIIAHWRRIGLAPARGPQIPAQPATGPVLVLAGSQSPVTARQMALALGASAGLFEGVRLDLSRQTGDGLDVEADALAAAAPCSGCLKPPTSDSPSHQAITRLPSLASIGGICPWRTVSSCGAATPRASRVLRRTP